MDEVRTVRLHALKSHTNDHATWTLVLSVAPHTSIGDCSLSPQSPAHCSGPFTLSHLYNYTTHDHADLHIQSDTHFECFPVPVEGGVCRHSTQRQDSNPEHALETNCLLQLLLLVYLEQLHVKVLSIFLNKKKSHFL